MPTFSIKKMLMVTPLAFISYVNSVQIENVLHGGERATPYTPRCNI